MKKPSSFHQTLWAGLAILTIGPGCTHNYYYGATPGCPPYGQTVTTQVGQVCEVPAGTVVTSNAAPTVISQETVTSATPSPAAPQRVVISQPAYNPSLSSRLGWKKPATEMATTRVDGALSDSTSTVK